MIRFLINANTTGQTQRPFAVALAVIVALLCMPLDRLYGQDHPRDVERKIFDLVNTERQQAGRVPLKIHPALEEAAQNYALFVAKLDPHSPMGHNLDGQSFDQRITKLGYHYTAAAENVYPLLPNTADPAQYAVHGVGPGTGWMKSAGHKANILNPAFKDTGVGVWRATSGWYYAVQVFGSTNNPAITATIKVTYFGGGFGNLPLKFALGGYGTMQTHTLAAGATGSYTVTGTQGQPSIYLYRQPDNAYFAMGFNIFDGYHYHIHGRQDRLGMFDIGLKQ